jgi:hypothetical protein
MVGLCTESVSCSQQGVCHPDVASKGGHDGHREGVMLSKLSAVAHQRPRRALASAALLSTIGLPQWVQSMTGAWQHLLSTTRRPCSICKARRVGCQHEPWQAPSIQCCVGQRLAGLLPGQRPRRPWVAARFQAAARAMADARARGTRHCGSDAVVGAPVARDRVLANWPAPGTRNTNV